MSRSRKDDIPSPCVAVCTLDGAHGLCLGCFRTVEEIAAWPRLDAAGRRAVLERVADRRAGPGSEPV